MLYKTQQNIINLNTTLMITIKDESFQIRKIRKANGKWQCFPKDKNAAPIELDADIVYGTLPSVRKFPWQTHLLQIKRADSFIISAVMDGLVLFEIPEEKYPENIKKELEHTQKLLQEIKEFNAAYDAKVKTAISDYLPLVPAVTDMETKISELPVAMRPYLKIRLYAGDKSAETKQRLALMYWLMTIVDRLYKRHVRKGTFESANGMLYFLAHRLDGTVDYNEAMVENMIENPQYKDSKLYVLYYEIAEQLNEVLPQLPKIVEIYCNYVVREVLYLVSQDIWEMEREETNHPRYYSIQRKETPHGIEERIYAHCRENMKLPQFVSFIMEQKFSSQEIENMHNNYNLL